MFFHVSSAVLAAGVRRGSAACLSSAIDGRELVAQVAADAATELPEPPEREYDVPQEWWDRYPGW